MTKKGLSDKRISEITGIPIQTLLRWKKTRDGYRIKLYRFLKMSDESFLIENFGMSEMEFLKEILGDKA